MKLDEHRQEYLSCMGATLSILFLIILTTFCYSKGLAWSERQDVNVMGAVIENAFDYSDQFSASEGLFISAALTEYDSNEEVIEDPKYGELVIKHYGWGDSEEIGSADKLLNYHWCSDEELGLRRSDKTQIFPVFESSLAEVLTYRKKFKCVDPDELVIWGDFNSKKSQ